MCTFSDMWKEQTGEADENETFMDMLIRVEDSKYHFEFQLLEDNMAIRMYEYSVKETIREIYEYHKSVKNGLEKLMDDGILTSDESHKLTVTLSDLENYLAEKDEEVKREVKQMGDKGYVAAGYGSTKEVA